MVTTVRHSPAAWLFSLLFALAASVTQTFADEVTPVFVAPSTPVIAGTRTSLLLYCINNSSNAIQRTFEAHLNGKLISPSGTLNVVLDLVTGPVAKEVTIALGAFAMEYNLNVPATVTGPVSLSISNYNEITFRVNEPATVTQPETQSTPALTSTNRPARTALAKFFDNHLSPYEPIYFWWEIILPPNSRSASNINFSISQTATPC